MIWKKNQQQRSSLLSHHGILEYMGWDRRYKLLVVMDASLLPLKTLLLKYSGYKDGIELFINVVHEFDL
jgi:hypothetical protein